MKFLVAGCGSIGRRHIRNLLSLGHTAIATDLLEQSREAAQAELGVQTFPSLESGLGQKPDAVLVCTPPSTHLEIAKAALEAGCHVFIEKPISDSLSGIAALGSLAKKKRKVVQVGYNLRFATGLRAMKEAMQSGKYGKPLYAKIQYAQ